jgi:hypothetical protein
VDKILTDGTAIMEDLEMDKFVTTVIKRVILLEALNSPSPRFSSFLDLTLLGSLSRSVKMLQSSS